MLGQLKQIVGTCHGSCPRFFLEDRLLGLAAVIKIWEDAPLFEGLEVLDNRSFYLARGVPELIPAAGSLGEDDSEKDSRLPSPILSESVPQTHNIGAQQLLELVDSLVEFRLLRKRPGNAHNLIVAFLFEDVSFLDSGFHTGIRSHSVRIEWEYGARRTERIANRRGPGAPARRSREGPELRSSTCRSCARGHYRVVRFLD